MNRQFPNNNRRVRWRWLLRRKNALNYDYKDNSGRNFQFAKFLFIDVVLTDRRIISSKQPKSASGKSSSCRFSFSSERNANTKATEYVTFGFSFSILVSFPFWESLHLSLSAIRIVSVLAAAVRESSNRQLILRIVKALPIIYQPDRVAPKASDVSAADWLYKHTWNNFFTCVAAAFLKAGNPCWNPSLCDKSMF